MPQEHKRSRIVSRLIVSGWAVRRGADLPSIAGLATGAQRCQGRAENVLRQAALRGEGPDRPSPGYDGRTSRPHGRNLAMHKTNLRLAGCLVLSALSGAPRA